MSPYKIEDAKNMRDGITLHLIEAIQEVMKDPLLLVNIKSSNITHTGLQPEGDVFTISFVIETHKKDPPKEEPK